MRSDWRKWFAWHPVRCIDGTSAWMRQVERRLIIWGCAQAADSYYEYRKQ